MADRRKDEPVPKDRLPALREGQKPVSSKGEESAPAKLGSLTRLRDVDVRITLEWGRTQITVEEALKLGNGGLMRLDQMAKELVDVRVNGKLFGRGKLVVVGDNYGVQLVEIIDSE